MSKHTGKKGDIGKEENEQDGYANKVLNFECLEMKGLKSIVSSIASKNGWNEA